MGRATNVDIDVHLEDGAPTSMARDVRRGLTAEPKRLPSKYFYDERGSELFERITELPEYYLTRAEHALLEDGASRIAGWTRPEDLVELGPGSARKTRLLIDAGLDQGSLRRYVPVEVSQEFAERTAHAVARRFPDIEVHAVVGDFERHLGQVPDGGRRLVALLGSTIGNFPEDEAADLLKRVGRLLGPDDRFLLGTDLVKDHEELEAAYNDSQGVTAEFNRNILSVVNRHLGGNFDTRDFEHRAFYNPQDARIESYLVATRPLSVALEALDLEVFFEEGEPIWTEVSCKYTRESVERLLGRANLELAHWLTDDEESFALSVSRLAA
jgi:L-histidine N-alpha-methyltransferase